MKSNYAIGFLSAGGSLAATHQICDGVWYRVNRSNRLMPKPWTTQDPERTSKVQAFMRDAFSDYVAARVLLLAHLPHQGAILSSTAIEKCIKAMLAFRGNESRGHLKAAHWNALCDFNKNLATVLDHDFVELNRRAYSLRYTDDLPSDYNLVIASREFLAEMDHTVHSLLSRFTVERAGKRRVTPFQAAINAGDGRVLAENHILSGLRKEEFTYQKAQFVYEVRRTARGLLEITYSTISRPKIAGFLRPGWTPMDAQGTNYELSHLPLPPNPDERGVVR